MKKLAVMALVVVTLTGCAGYQWQPERMSSADSTALLQTGAAMMQGSMQYRVQPPQQQGYTCWNHGSFYQCNPQ